MQRRRRQLTAAPRQRHATYDGCAQQHMLLLRWKFRPINCGMHGGLCFARSTCWHRQLLSKCGKALQHSRAGASDARCRRTQATLYFTVPMQTLMRERRAAAWRHLNVVERDVLIVITALCKVGDQPD